MDLRVLGCHGGETPNHRTSAFLLDDTLAFFSEVCRDATRYDLVHQITMAEQRCIVAQQLLLENPELGETEGQGNVIAEVAEVTNGKGEKVTIKRPYVIKELCIGCGMCEFQCPMGGEAAVRVFAYTEAGGFLNSGG